MKPFSYSQISLIMDTWDKARFSQSNNFNQEFGITTLQHLFDIYPRSKKSFGYDKGEDIGKSTAEIHANAFASVFDSVFQLLGPDIEFLEEILIQVGQRHKIAGVNPSHFAFMGKALIYTVEVFLERNLTGEERDAWEEVYDAISEDLIKQILS